MIGEFIINDYILAKTKIENHQDDERDRLYVEVCENIFSNFDELDFKIMLKDYTLPNVQVTVPDKLIE